jgi:arginine-tRNA-protein transferase
MIIDLIERCNELGLPYVYLGYYIEQSRKMSYKARFKPYQVFNDGAWQDH